MTPDTGMNIILSHNMENGLWGRFLPSATLIKTLQFFFSSDCEPREIPKLTGRMSLSFLGSPLQWEGLRKNTGTVATLT